MTTFYDITSEAQFTQAVRQLKGKDAEFLYCCGSSTTNPKNYVTNTFKRHIPVTQTANRRSTCIGVETAVKLSFDEKKELLTIENLSDDQPVGDTAFFKHLKGMNSEGTLTGYFKENVMPYLMTLGFRPGYSRISEEQLQILRNVHELFWFLKHNGKLRVSEEANDYTAEPPAGSVESEIFSLAINGNRLELPREQLQHYAKIKTLMTRAGAKYQKLGFTFPVGTDVEKVKRDLIAGTEVNDKKKYQFFSTPDNEAKDLIEEADLQAGERWLEPSAGQAHIARLAAKISKDGVMAEFMPQNAKILREMDIAPVFEGDFLTMDATMLGGTFDKIIANPPFTKNQDIDHLGHMTTLLSENGRVTCITSTHYQHASTLKCEAFRAWLSLVEAKVTPIKAGAFSESGTNVATQRVTIDESNISVAWNEFLTSYQRAA